MSNKRIINMIVDHDSKTFRPINYEEFIYILSFFDNKSQVTVTIEPFVRKVEKPQMGLLHAYINEIHKETGEDKERVKIEMKKRYGMRNDDGSLKSTSNYTTVEMNKLIECVYIFMTQDLNIHIPTPEEWKNKNIK